MAFILEKAWAFQRMLQRVPGETNSIFVLAVCYLPLLHPLFASFPSMGFANDG
jgi:hypothetical protein